MNVSYLPTITKKCTPTTITFEAYLDLIKSNPKINQIEYLRTLEYGSEKYKSYKEKLPAVKIHGEFCGINDVDLIALNNYLYFDIDGIGMIPPETLNDTNGEMIPSETLNDTKQRLIDLNICSYIFKSIGGKGLSILIYVPQLKELVDIDPAYHKKTWNYIKDTCLSNFKLDTRAYSLSRNLLITSDPEIYSNEVSLDVDQVSIDNFIATSPSGKVKNSGTSGIIKSRRGIQVGVNDTFSIIPYKELLTQIVIKTAYEKEIIGDYVLDPIDYHEIYIPKNIYDGSKHKVYAGIVNKLIILNPTITFEQTISFMVNVNEHAQPPMLYQKLFKNVYYWYCLTIDNLKVSGGLITSVSRVKKIQFNKNRKLTTMEKQIISAKAIGRERTNKTIDKIELAKMELGASGTQKEVALKTGLSIATVKRNWKKQKMDVNGVEMEFAPREYSEDEITDDASFQKFIDELPTMPGDFEVYGHKNLPENVPVKKGFDERETTVENDYSMFEPSPIVTNDDEFWK